jgi:NAD(P)-dependent dehydrogenase (short-subunit alcohol dehydrogenase family)
MPSDRAVIVTGASQGIGAAIVRALDSDGWTVFGLSRSGTAPAGHAMACDVTDEAAVSAAFKEVAGRAQVTALVNNAGVHHGGPSRDLATEEYETVMRLNATALMVACREIYPPLVANIWRARKFKRG